MRMKELWNFVPIPANLKLVWDRLTFSRLTTGYFLFSLCHFVIQVAIQVRAFSINADAATFLYSIASQGGNLTTQAIFPVLGSDLRICNRIPDSFSTSSCTIIWNGTKNTNNTLEKVGSGGSAYFNNQSNSMLSLASTSVSSADISTSATLDSLSTLSSTSLPAPTLAPLNDGGISPETTVTIFVRPTPSAVTITLQSIIAATPVPVSNQAKSIDERRAIINSRSKDVDGEYSVILNGLTYHNVPAKLDSTCLLALTWPISILDNTKREDIVFIGFQFWVLGMSTVALLNESIPHILASLLTHALVTAWAGFQIVSTAALRASFNTVITNGACGVPLLSVYWKDRAKAEIPSLALNVLALFISAFLTWRLVKLFGWQTFKRVGASRTINRIYKIVLTLSITIQLSLFFMVVTVALWIDQLYNGYIARLATLSELYRIAGIITLVLLVPWLAIGWIAVRRELKIPMLIFLVLSVGYLGEWGAMFLSTSFRWTFVTWRFFSVMASASVLLTLMSFVLGVICRWNFGRSLSRYLNAQESLPDDEFVPAYPSDPEKFAFPSNEKAIPTYSASFGSGCDDVPQNQMQYGSNMGPRFYDNSAAPFDPRSNVAPVTTPQHAHTRSDERSQVGAPLVRNGTCSSERSFESTFSDVSRQNSRSSDSDRSVNGKRWVIE